MLTSPFRQARAARHLLRAARRRLSPGGKLAKGASARMERRADLLPSYVVPSDAQAVLPAPGAVEPGASSCESCWHTSRARGQAQRFANVDLCGIVDHVLEGKDPDTGEVVTTRDLAQHCGAWRVCRRCARRRKLRAREDVLRARTDALRVYRRELRRGYRQSEGRWGERLMTLTVPHSGDVGEDARVLRLAWPIFQERMLAHLRIDRGAARRPVWVRAMEIAPSEDGGHAHLHVWMVSPYLDHVWARVTWGRVLQKLGVDSPTRPWNAVMHLPPLTCPIEQTEREFRRSVRGLKDVRVRRWCRTRRGKLGREVSALPWPHVDIRSAVDEDGGAATYATKVGVALVYTAKGTNIPAAMDAFHAAAVYQALEGARAIQWCRGWAPKRDVRLSYRVRRLTAEERFARGTGPDPQTLRPEGSLVSSHACNANSAEPTSQSPTTGPPSPSRASTVDEPTQTHVASRSKPPSSEPVTPKQLSLL